MTRKRPHELTLEILKVGTTLTPAEIDQHVNLRTKDGKLGEYAGKHVWFLKKLGFTIDTLKDGRTVQSYTMTGEPDNAEQIRAGAPAKQARVPKAQKTPKAPKAPKEKVAKVVAPKAPKVTKVKAAKAQKEESPTDSVPVVQAPVKNAAALTEDRLAAFKAAKARLALKGIAPVVAPVSSVAVDPEFDYAGEVHAAMLTF